MADAQNGNLFYLTVDSLSYFYFNEYFDSVREELDGVEFTNAVSTASNTNSAAPMLAAGVRAETIDDVGLPAEGPPVPVAEVLAADGYDCGLWTANFLIGKHYNYDRGFGGGNKGEPSVKRRIAGLLEDHDRLYSFAEWTYFNVLSYVFDLVGEDSAIWRSADTLHDSTLQWLDGGRSDDVFCWLHYMDVHHPYMPQEEYLDSHSFNRDWDRQTLGHFTRTVVHEDGENATREELEDVQAAYELCCEYLDDRMASFIRTLKERGHFVPERDTLVVTADHGESFHDTVHGQMGHESLWEEVVQVPLLISTPDWDPETVDGQASLLDLVPTVLSLLGYEPPDSTEGNVRETPEAFETDRAYFSNAQPWFNIRRGVRTASGTKLFGHKRSDGEYELVRTEYEPGDELHEDIALREDVDRPDRFRDGLEPAAVRQLFDDVVEHKGELVEDSGEFVIDDELEGHLQDLGYME